MNRISHLYVCATYVDDVSLFSIPFCFSSIFGIRTNNCPDSERANDASRLSFIALASYERFGILKSIESFVARYKRPVYCAWSRRKQKKSIRSFLVDVNANRTQTYDNDLSRKPIALQRPTSYDPVSDRRIRRKNSDDSTPDYHSTGMCIEFVVTDRPASQRGR